MRKLMMSFLFAVIFLALVIVGAGMLAEIYPPEGWKCYENEGKRYCYRFNPDGTLRP